MTRKSFGLSAFLLTGALIAVIGVFAKPALAQYPYGFGQGNGYNHQDRDWQDRDREGNRGFRDDQGGQLRWRGDVDGTTIVYIHGRNVWTQTVEDRSATDVGSRVFGFLPYLPTRIVLQNWQGRGYVQVVQEPSPNNDFTAAIRVCDPQPGRGHYEFAVGWR